MDLVAGNVIDSQEASKRKRGRWWRDQRWRERPELELYTIYGSILVDKVYFLNNIKFPQMCVHLWRLEMEDEYLK